MVGEQPRRMTWHYQHAAVDSIDGLKPMYAPKRATLSKKQQQRKRAQAAETPPPPPSNKAFKRGQNGRAKVVPLTAALPANSSRQGWAQVIEKELVDAAGTVFCQIKWKGKVPRSILPEEDETRFYRVNFGTF